MVFSELRDKVFPFAMAEFYDIEHDMLMKIYSAKGYDKYCEEEEDVAK